MESLMKGAYLLSILVAFLVPGGIFAAAGDLDFGFDFDGLVRTDFYNSADAARAVVLQVDGKIIVCGSALINGDFDFALARYNSDGSLDSSFGNGGKITTPIGNANEECNAIAIQQDGKIVAAGWAQTAYGQDFAIVRYNANGFPDSTFGTAGRVITDFAALADVAHAVAVQQNGKIVAAGFSNWGNRFDFSLVRYNTDGTLDNGFEGDGKIITMIDSASDVYGIAIQSNQKIVVAGFSWSFSGGSDFALARYNTNGSLDSNFDSDGIATTDFGTPGDQAHAIALQNDGKIVVAGHSHYDGHDFTLARYNSNGSLDQNFGIGGKVITSINSGNDSFNSVLLQNDGKIVAAGEAAINGTDPAFAVARYSSVGVLDSTFGSFGVVFTNFSGSKDQALGALLQPDGKIVAAGVATVGSSVQDIAIARYHGDLSGPWTFCDQFAGPSIPQGWSYSKPVWALNQGYLIGNSVNDKTTAIAHPVFPGCDLCTVETSISTEGGIGGKVSFFGWYQDKRNNLEIQMNEQSDKWIIKQRHQGRTVAKEKVSSTILPNVFYKVKVNFDGREFMLTIDGQQVIHMPAAVTQVNGTVGFGVKGTLARFAYISVE